MEELAAAGVISPPVVGIGPAMAGPTLLAIGTEEQNQRYLPGLAKGEDTWCQLWSEPRAGSDLPAMSTTAVRDGDRYVVNGQRCGTRRPTSPSEPSCSPAPTPTPPTERG